MPFSRVSRFGIVNTYLLEEEDGLTVIDTMLPGSTKAILSGADAHGIPIARILLTHAHGDHIGSLDALHEAVPDAEVIISARDARLLQQGHEPRPGRAHRQAQRQLPGRQDRADADDRAGRAGRLAGGDRGAGPHPRAPRLPRHPRRDPVLRRRLLDPRRGRHQREGELALPPPGARDLAQPTALESARALRALDPKRLAPGHGKVVENPAAAMDAAIAKAS